MRGHATPPEQAGRQMRDYTKLGSSPGGDRPTFIRCCKILWIDGIGDQFTIPIGRSYLKPDPTFRR